MNHKQINHKDQKLSKDMKKQGHVSSKKPSNKKISSEDSLAEKPKKGSYREPNSKKLDGEKFLSKDHKLTHIKEFTNFLNEGIEEYIIDGERNYGDERSFNSNVLIRVFCGISVENKCGYQLHPLNEVKRAKEIVDRNTSIDCYSNSTDFVSAIKYYGLEKGIKTEFYLDGKSCGEDIESIFENFNKSIDLLNELCPNIK